MAASFTFDNQAAKPNESLIAEAAAQRLVHMRYDAGDEASGRGPYVRSIARLPLPLDQVDDMAPWIKVLLRHVPAIGIWIGDSQIEARGISRQLQVQTDVDIYLVVGHGTKQVQGRLESRAADERHDPGLDVFVQHTVENLAYYQPESVPGAGLFLPRTIRKVGTSEDLSVALLRFDLRHVWQVRPEREATPVDEIHANHDVQQKGILARQRKMLT